MLEYINDFDSLYYDLRKTESVGIQEILDSHKKRILIERQNIKIEKWNKMLDEIEEKYLPEQDRLTRDQDRLKANTWAKIARERQKRIDEMETKRDSKIEEAVEVRKDFINTLIEGKPKPHGFTYKFDKYAGEAVLRDDGELERQLNLRRDKLMEVNFQIKEIYERPITDSLMLLEAHKGILSRLNETKERLEQKIEELEPILDFEKSWAIELRTRLPGMNHIAMEMLGERIWREQNYRREERREEKERIKRMEERERIDWEKKIQEFWEPIQKEKERIKRIEAEAARLVSQQIRKEKEAKQNEIAKKEQEEKRRKSELFNYFDKKKDLITYMRQNPGELDKLKELADMGAWRKTYYAGERELDEYLVLYNKAAWAIRRDEIDAAKAESEAKDKEWRRTRTWGQTLSQLIWPTTRLEEERKKQEEEDQREIDKHLEEQKRQQEEEQKRQQKEQKRQQEATRQQEEQKRQQKEQKTQQEQQEEEEEQKRQEDAKRQLIKETRRREEIKEILGAEIFDALRIGIHTQLVVSMEKYLKDPHTFTENVNMITSTILSGYGSLPERIHKLNNSAKIGFDAYSAALYTGALVCADYIAMLEIVKDDMLNSTNSYTDYRKFSVAANTLITTTINQAKNIKDRFERERKSQEERTKYENEVREREWEMKQMKEATRITDIKERAYQNSLSNAFGRKK
jgi:hypothetical protein